jgi:Transposase DDE domain
METPPKNETMPRLPSIVEEFASAELGNISRTRSLCWLAELMSQCPDRSFPKAARDASELARIYRLLGSEYLRYERILEPHYIQTAARMSSVSRVLMLHDTTDGAFEGEGRIGLGRLAGPVEGFVAHTSLAVAGDGTRRPLGVMNVHCWARTQAPRAKKTATGRKLSGSDYAKQSDKESDRWFEAVHLTTERAESHCNLIHIADREGDNFAFLADMMAAGHRFHVRLTHNRTVGAEVVVGERDRRQVLLSRRKGHAAPGSRKTHEPREQRPATLEIRATTVVLQKPRYLDSSMPAWLPVHVVHVVEVDAPEDVEPVEWMIVTTESIETTQDILQIVDDYRTRWLIEEFFKALKTGCALEKRQLTSYEALTNALAVFVPIAWQLLLLRNLSRTEPEAPATEVLTPTQIDVLRVFVPKANLLPSPTIRQVLLAVARLGGHLSNNGDPGWLVLGRGLEELLLLERGWTAALSRATDGKKLVGS